MEEVNSTFPNWLSSFSWSNSIHEKFKKLKIIKFFYHQPTKTITWILNNDQPLSYQIANEIEIALTTIAKIQKINWFYQKINFNESSVSLINEYFSVFVKNQDLRIDFPKIIWNSTTKKIIFKGKTKYFYFYEKEIGYFLEKWGITLSFLTSHDVSKPPIATVPKAFSTTTDQFVFNKKTTPTKSSPIILKASTSKNSTTRINQHSRVPPFRENEKFILDAEVLKITTNTFHNKTIIKILIDTGNEAQILTTFSNSKIIQKEPLPKVDQWYQFSCQFFHYQRWPKATFEKKIRYWEFKSIEPFFTRFDFALEKRIELHTHTKMSSLDGVVSCKDYLKLAEHFGHSAIAFTDHENIHSFAALENLIDQFPNQKIIFGCEFNTIPIEIKVLSRPVENQDWATTEFLVLDIETTGLALNYEEIIEFAGIVLKGGFKISESNFLITSKIPISKEITELTNITPEEQNAKGISPQEAAKRIAKLIENKILIAHNAKFDISFLNKFLIENNQLPINNPIIDTIPLSHCAAPGRKSYRLGRLARFFSIPFHTSKGHRALYDTQILAKLFDKLLISLKLKSFSALFALNNTHSTRFSAIPWHANVLVQNKIGLQNLYRLISLSHTKTLYRKPTLERADFQKNRTGLLIGSGCVNGEVFQIAAFGSDQELTKSLAFYDYIEIQPPNVYRHLVDRQFFSVDEIKLIIKKIIAVAQMIQKTVVATGDVHFLNPNDAFFRDIYIFNKQLKGLAHPLFDYKGRIKTSPPQFLRTTTEMKEAFAFLNDQALIHQIVVTNTHKIAAKIEKIRCFPNSLSIPVIPDAVEKLTKKAKIDLSKKYGKKIDSFIQERFDYELQQIIKQGYETIYLITENLTSYSHQKKYLIGSRGSVGSSFLAYCLGITEVNPLPPHYYCFQCSIVEWAESEIFSGFDLPSKICSGCQKMFSRDGQRIAFESFLGLDGSKLPDIDLNFSSLVQNEVQLYLTNWLTERLGQNKVFRAGTVSSVAEKTAFGYWKSYQEKFNLNDPSPAEVEKILFRISGVKRTTGQHPGGLMIIPADQDVHNFTPFNFSSNNSTEKILTTHFDYRALDNYLLKIDLLGHDDPTALKYLEKLTGRDPLTIPMVEPAVMRIFSNITALGISIEKLPKEKTGSLGLPEFGTDFVRGILSEVKVQTFADLISVSGLSHGTNVWTNNARDILRENKNFTFQNVIACRDDIMNFLIKYKLSKTDAYKIMQKIRKGKHLNSTEVSSLQALNVPTWFIESCQKIVYLFPKAHATAYAIMAYRFAWYKLHFPAEFYATYFSIRCEVFDVLTIQAGPVAINAAIKTINRNIRTNLKKATSKEKTLLTIYAVSLEMYARGIKFSPLDLEYSVAENFIVRQVNKSPTIYPSFLSIDWIGQESARLIVSEREKKLFNTQEDFLLRSRVNKTVFENLKIMGVFKKIPASRQKSFFNS